MRKVPAQLEIDPLQRKYDGELHEIVVVYLSAQQGIYKCLASSFELAD